MSRIFTVVLSILVMFGISTLLITGVGIVVGLTNKHIVQPVVEWAQDPGPVFEDDPRCCR